MRHAKTNHKISRRIRKKARVERDLTNRHRPLLIKILNHRKSGEVVVTRKRIRRIRSKEVVKEEKTRMQASPLPKVRKLNDGNAKLEKTSKSRN